MKAIVSTRTDHTNVYGYVTVEVLKDGLVDDDAFDRLPRHIREECRYQHPSTSSKSLQGAEEYVIKELEELGFEVIEK